MFCLAMFLLLAFCICIYIIYITTIMWLSTEVIQMQCLALTRSQTISHTCYARFVRLGHMVKHARWAAFHYFGVITLGRKPYETTQKNNCESASELAKF